MTWKELGFSRTQVVVLKLMIRMPNKGRGYTVWLDNFFISSKLLSTLRNYSIEAADIIWTDQIKQEENEGKK